MQILQLKPHITTSELSEKLAKCDVSYKRTYWQILSSISFNPNKKAEEYAAFLGVTKSKIYKVVERYNNEGVSFIEDTRWGGRRSKTSYLSIEEEQQMMDDIIIKAKEGSIIVAKHIRKIVEAKVGKAVSDDYLWDLLNRHNWKKKMPRPEHPKCNKEAQEEFKKNSQKYWKPNE